MFNSKKKEQREEVKGMNMVNKAKYALTSAFAAGSVAVYGGLEAFAEGDNSGGSGITKVAEPVNKGLMEVVSVLTGIGWTLVILMIVVIGVILIFGGDKSKEKVKSHIVAIIIGGVLIAGASAIGTWWRESLSGSQGVFNGQ